jgi:DNA-binding NarL/FixJ family response regulator
LPWIKVIMLAAFAGADLEAAANTGVHGFVDAGLPAGEFFALVEAVSSGAMPVIAPRRALPLDDDPPVASNSGSEDLTARERVVLRLLVEGVTTNRELAARLLVSENTVRYHVRNLLAKLRLDNRAQAVAAAVRNALVADPSE